MLFLINSQCNANPNVLQDKSHKMHMNVVHTEKVKTNENGCADVINFCGYEVSKQCIGIYSFHIAFNDRKTEPTKTQKKSAVNPKYRTK